MRILYDARWILVEDRFDGVSRYSQELARTLVKQKGLEVAWLVYDKRQLAKLPPGEVVWANNPNSVLKEFFTFTHTINKSGYELLYSPVFMMGTIGKKFKLILTIHDLIYFTHRTPPQWLSWYIRLGWRLFHLTYWPLRWQLNRADAIATVSNTAKNELIEAKVTKRPIYTVLNAVSNEFKATPNTKALNGVVYMGSFTPYKNVECVIDAVSLVPDVMLHLCGKLPPSRRRSIINHLKSRGVYNRTIIYDGATDNQYKKALKNALCAISASRLEGFGLPLIEAQQAGVPFIASDTPIFNEVGGDSVLFFNPNKPKEAAECIESFKNPKIRNKYIALGTKNAAKYTWQNSAKQAVEIIKIHFSNSV